MAPAECDAPVICVVDDDEAIRESMRVLLLSRGMTVKTFESAKAFLYWRAEQDCSCLLVDMHMPEMTGLALLLTLRDLGSTTPAIVITAGGDQALAEQVVRAGAMGLLRKPVNEHELFAWIDRAIAGARPVGAEMRD